MPSEDIRVVKERLHGYVAWLEAPDDEGNPYEDFGLDGGEQKSLDLRALLTHVDELEAAVAAMERVTIGPLSYTAMRAAKDAAEARVSALEGAAQAVLDRDGELSPSGMPNGCSCINLSREAEREYEGGRCPHQRLRATLSSPAPVKEDDGGQDRKFAFRNGQFVNRVSGEPIPKDEPVMLFRARDKRTLHMLHTYLEDCEDPHHRQAIKDRIGEFEAFQSDHADRVKEPGITRHIRLNDDREPVKEEVKPVERMPGTARQHIAILTDRGMSYEMACEALALIIRPYPATPSPPEARREEIARIVRAIAERWIYRTAHHGADHLLTGIANDVASALALTNEEGR